MKRGKLIGALLLFLLPIFLWVGLANAQSFRTGSSTTVPTGEVVDSTLYIAGQNVDIAGEVRGDVFCTGQNISVSGRVTGDVICAGQTVRVSGTVDGDVRLAGQTVAIGGTVNRNASVAAQSFTLEAQGRIGGDISVGADDSVLNGTVNRDAAIGSTTATIANRIGRNVKATVDQLTLTSQARVGGDLTYTSHNNADLQQGAQVAGDNIKYQPPQEDKANYGPVLGIGFGFLFYLFISLLVTAIALVLLFPSVFHETSDLALREPLKTFLFGLAASLLVPVLIIVLMVTVIGIPLALLLLLIWLVIMALNGPFFAYYLGRLIMHDDRHPVLILVVGALIVLVAYLIPFIGILMFLAVMWFGTGMFLRQIMRRTPPPRYDVNKPKKAAAKT